MSRVHFFVYGVGEQIVVMFCALIGGFGFSAMLGFKLNTIVLLVPFILLGVGVDDMLILVDACDREFYGSHPSKSADNMGKAIRHAG